MSCCIKACSPYVVGCVDPCGALEIGYAVTAGTYTLKTQFAGRVKEISKVFATGETLSFPIKGLNESYTFTAQVLRENGDVMKFEHAGVCYDGFIFETNIGVNTPHLVTNFTAC